MIRRRYFWLFDALIIILSFIAAYYFFSKTQLLFTSAGPLSLSQVELLSAPAQSGRQLPPIDDFLWILGVVLPVTILLMEISINYSPNINKSYLRLILASLVAPFIGLSLITMIMFALKMSETSRLFIFSFSFLAGLGLGIYRAFIRFYLLHRHQQTETKIEDLLRSSAPTTPYEVIKRALDIMIALAVLVIFAPLWIIIAFIIRVTSPGPVFYLQKQAVGKEGQKFTLYKFRTMDANSDDKIHREVIAKFVSGEEITKDQDDNTTTVYKLVQDPRITPIGKFLRKIGLDEIPQFINVLRNEMSVVGPRPPVTYEYEHYDDEQRKRLNVLPGITGLYQVTARSQVPIDEMVEIDLNYIEKQSLWTDIRIIFKTVWVMLTGKGAY